ncbi:MAG: hypothetical protein JRH05_13505 [Deltaproteobacteria bacterium]|nr:hypothetical protein [Deltaproteobacteria bacterium]
MRELGEVVLVYYEDKPAVYGRIEAIEPDVKKDWYHLTLLLLTIPTQVVTWILREAYIDGDGKSPDPTGNRAARGEGSFPSGGRRAGEGGSCLVKACPHQAESVLIPDGRFSGKSFVVPLKMPYLSRC